MIRTDFVSNSSSTSFAIIGKDYSKDELINIFRNKTNKDFDSHEDLVEFMWNYLDKIDKLEVCRGLNNLGSDTIIIGLSYGHMKQNETRQHFEERIIDKLKEYGLPVSDNKVEFFLDEGYDG